MGTIINDAEKKGEQGGELGLARLQTAGAGCRSRCVERTAPLLFGTYDAIVMDRVFGESMSDRLKRSEDPDAEFLRDGGVVLRSIFKQL